MSNQAQDAVNKITETKLSEYGVKQKEERVTATNYQPAPVKTKTKTYTPKPTTSRAEWRKKFPDTIGASVMDASKRKKMEVLRNAPCLTKTDAVYSEREYAELVQSIQSGLMDVLDGHGIVCKSATDLHGFLKAMTDMLPDAFKHCDDDGVYRYIVVAEQDGDDALDIPDFLRRD